MQISGIRTILQHLHIVVGLDHQVVGTINGLLDIVGNATHIGKHHKHNTFNLQLVAHILAGIVRHSKRAHLKVAKLYLLANYQLVFMILRYFLRYTIILVYALVYFMSGINRQVTVVTQGAHTFYVVCVVVCYQDTFYRIQLYNGY